MTGPDDPDGRDESFLSRWSRRKRQIAPAPSEGDAIAAAPASRALASETDDTDTRPRDPETGEVIDTDLVNTLPDISGLQPGDDLSGFMKKGVPEALRRTALRTMWASDPVIRDFVDPALDYAYDYNIPGGAPGYGPLSESDIAQAKEFLANVFSTPQQPDDAENVAHGPDRDNPSQTDVHPAPEAVRMSNAAVQQVGSPEELPGSTAAAEDRDTATDAPQSGTPAMVQRSAPAPGNRDDQAKKPVKQSSQRQRSGGATPI